MATVGSITLSEMRSRLGRLIGLPGSVTPRMEAALNQYIQDALREIYSYARWEFLEAAYRIELEAAYTTGTVAVTAAGTSWTGTGTSWATGFDDAGLASIRAAGEVYRVTSIDSTTGLTATDAALETLTAEDYVLYMDVVSLPSALESIDSCHVSRNSRRLDPMQPAVMAGHKSRGYRGGSPQYFAPFGTDASAVRQLELYPIPGANEILHVRGYKAGTIPTADGGASDIPDRFLNVVMARAKSMMYEAMKDARMQTAVGEYANGIFRMVMDASLNQGPMAVGLDPAVYGPRSLSHDATQVRID